jgi:hypothetical protein
MPELKVVLNYNSEVMDAVKQCREKVLDMVRDSRRYTTSNMSLPMM